MWTGEYVTFRGSKKPMVLHRQRRGKAWTNSIRHRAYLPVSAIWTLRTGKGRDSTPRPRLLVSETVVDQFWPNGKGKKSVFNAHGDDLSIWLHLSSFCHAFISNLRFEIFKFWAPHWLEPRFILANNHSFLAWQIELQLGLWGLYLGSRVDKKIKIIGKLWVYQKSHYVLVTSCVFYIKRLTFNSVFRNCQFNS